MSLFPSFTIITYKCDECGKDKSLNEYDCSRSTGKRILPFCKDCSDKNHIAQVEVKCSAGCNRKLPPSYFGHYRTRFKEDGNRLRVNTNCKDCSKKESKVLSNLKKKYPPPEYLTSCPQCNKIVYEKSEDIPENVNGTNGPWQCDHDHKTGMFRGYLCKKCNVGRGLVGDSKEAWENIIKTKKVKTGKKNG